MPTGCVFFFSFFSPGGGKGTFQCVVHFPREMAPRARGRWEYERGIFQTWWVDLLNVLIEKTGDVLKIICYVSIASFVDVLTEILHSGAQTVELFLLFPRSKVSHGTHNKQPANGFPYK